MARKIRGGKILRRSRGSDQKTGRVHAKSHPEGVCKLVMMLLHSVTNTHVMHLRSRSFSEHMALGGYYAAVDKHVDSLVEAYQGMHGLITDYPMENDYQAGMKPLDYLRYLREGVVANRGAFPGSELQNILDTIIELIDSTVYKLRFLH